MPKTCNHDCLNCKYAECISPDLTYEELRQSDAFDKRIQQERKNTAHITQRVVKDENGEVSVITLGVDMTRYIHYKDRTDLNEYLIARDREYDLKRYHKNPDKFRKKSLECYNAHRESRLKTCKEYYEKNKETRKAYSRQYYEQHREEISQRRKEQRRAKKNAKKSES